MSKVTLFFRYGQGIIEHQARIGSRLANAVRKAGLSRSNFSKCNYKLECGECIVQSKERFFSDPSAEEEILLSNLGAPNNSRCSCQIVVDESFENKVIEIITDS